MHPISRNDTFQIINNFFVNPIFSISYIVVIIILLSNMQDLSNDNNNKRLFNSSKFFLVYTFIALWLFMFLFYKCEYYHRYFFLIFIIITIWIQKQFLFNKDKTKNEQIKNIVFYVALSIIFLTPMGWIDMEGGNRDTFEYFRTIKADSKKFENSVLIFADCPFLLYYVAPFLINKKNIKLYKGNVKYDYRMDNNIASDDKKILEISQKTDKQVYIIRENISENYPNNTNFNLYNPNNINYDLYELIDNYNNVISVYKVK